MDYIDSPKTTVENVQTLMREKHEIIANPFLKKLVSLLGIDETEFDTQKSIEMLHVYIDQNSKEIVQQHDLTADFIEKKHIENACQFVNHAFDDLKKKHS